MAHWVRIINIKSHLRVKVKIITLTYVKHDGLMDGQLSTDRQHLCSADNIGACCAHHKYTSTVTTHLPSIYIVSRNC